MCITIIPIVGPIIWISQITSRMAYTVQKYALPISLKITDLIKTLYIIGKIGALIFSVIAFLSLFVLNGDADIFLFVSIVSNGAWVLVGASLICVLVAMILLFEQYSKLADALSYVPSASMPQMDMYNQPMNYQFAQQPMQQPQPDIAVINQMTENNQRQDN